MKAQLVRLTARFFDFLKLLATPRRSFAYRQLERERDRLEGELAEARRQNQKLYDYVLLVTNNPAIADAQPKEKAPAEPRKPARPTRAQIDAKYQQKFAERAEQRKAAQPASSASEPSFPNHFEPKNVQ